MKTRIAIWTHGGVGGGLYSQGQPAIQNLIKRLSAYYSVDVFMKTPPNKDFKAEGFMLFSANRHVKMGICRWIYLSMVFVRSHSKSRYGLVYSFWGYPAGVIVAAAERIFGIPSVIHLQGGDAANLPSVPYGVFCHPLRGRICKWAYSQCQTLIALTDYQARSLEDSGISRALVIIPYGVDRALFTYQPCRNGAVLRFVHIANQTAVKDQETLLKAFALVCRRLPACLTFIGAEFNSEKLRVLCADLGIAGNVKFIGPQPHRCMPKYYHESDILLHTSFYEGQGLVFMEAAACGTLLAGTRVGQLADMGSECGIVVSVGDADDLAGKILEVMPDRERIDAMKIAAHKWANEKDENFTVNRIVEELNKLL